MEGIKQKIDALKMQCDELEKQRIEFVKVWRGNGA